MKWEGALSRSFAVSAPADWDAYLLYYSCHIIIAGRGMEGGGQEGRSWGRVTSS